MLIEATQPADVSLTQYTIAVQILRLVEDYYYNTKCTGLPSLMLIENKPFVCAAFSTENADTTALVAVGLDPDNVAVRFRLTSTESLDDAEKETIEAKVAAACNCAMTMHRELNSPEEDHEENEQ